MGKPKHIYSWKAIFWPFTNQLWFGTIFSAVLVIIVYKFLAWKEKCYEINWSPDIFRRHIAESICMTLVEQDIIYPIAVPSRMLSCVWLFAALIFTTAYRSKVVNLMTFPLLQTLPKTFQELTESNFQWGLESAAIGGAAHQHFRTSSNPVNRKISEKMSLERNSQKCFTQGITKNFACITWSTQGEYILHRNFTNNFNRNPLVMSEDLSAIVGSGIAYRKRALFKSNFDRVIGFIREMGMADKWKWMDYDKEREDHLKWLKAGNKLDGTNSETDVEGQSRGLIMDKLNGPFYILGVGLLIALLKFLVELFMVYTQLGRLQEITMHILVQAGTKLIRPSSAFYSLKNSKLNFGNV
ncbi:unnamed protein product [Allacma fusca]|uniref:Ionotropic glutamate receptor C-terminal domain-containing protein n=1 Tax=Allacma fusca TaxID=39272 RepID=A0A8J2L2M7_9HEXA|nr:unnamed protein product [Allacma fusca]